MKQSAQRQDSKDFEPLFWRQVMSGCGYANSLYVLSQEAESLLGSVEKTIFDFSGRSLKTPLSVAVSENWTIGIVWRYVPGDRWKSGFFVEDPERPELVQLIKEPDYLGLVGCADFVTIVNIIAETVKKSATETYPKGKVTVRLRDWEHLHGRSI